MKYRASLLLSVGLTFAAPSAFAGGLFSFDPAEPGFYISGHGGVSFLSDSTFEGVSDPVAGIPGPTGAAGVPLNVDVNYDTGYTFGGAVGYQLPFKYWGVFHPRLELEVSYLESDVSAGSFNGGNQTFQGSQDAVFVYLNNYSDIKFSEDQKLVPYIGGGFGAAFVNSDVGYFPGAATAPTFAVTGDDTAFASHAAVGLSYELSENLDLYSEARYFRIYSTNLDRTFVGGGANLFNGEVDDNIEGINVTAGVRLRF